MLARAHESEIKVTLRMKKGGGDRDEGKDDLEFAAFLPSLLTFPSLSVPLLLFEQ